jgi:pyruvate formate lyase activating enzyme
MSDDPLIFEIKRNSLDDGPGIRTVIFFKGCPLSCAWCQNPEGRRPRVDISFERSKCIGCKTCIKTCRKSALDRHPVYFIEREKCDLCFECADNCPTGALARVGRQIPVQEIVDSVVRDIPFFNTSGGGVTLSGGEATLFMPYASNLLQALKLQGVNTLLETCGFFDFNTFDELLYPWLDAIYFDLKFIDSGYHKQYCGVPNELILSNFEKLYARALKGGVPVLPRVPLVPRLTAVKPNLRALAAFLKKNRVKQISLLEYNPLWQDKMIMIGMPSVYEKSDWMTEKEVKLCKSFFKRFELV